MATSYTSNKKIGALDSASTPLAATNEIVINQNGDILKTPLSAVEAKVFDAKTQTTTPTGTEVTIVRQTDGSLRQVPLANIVPALNITNAQISNSAAIDDTKLATINTAGKVTNNAVQAVSTNTANRIVTRDGSGNFAAGTVTATLSGNATTATTLQTGRTIALTGDVTGTTGSFNGSANVSAATTIANNAVTTAKIADANVTTAKIADANVTTAKIADGGVTSAKIADGTIVNADINASAAIAGTKISPDFGSQNVVTTGTIKSTLQNIVDGAAATFRFFATRTNNISRWDFGVTDEAESGSNSGSNFFLHRFADNGAFLSRVWHVSRATGNVGIGNSSPAAKLHVSGDAIISANTSTDALRVTQEGSGNALLIEDSANPDSTPLVVNHLGQIISGATTAFNTTAGLQITADSADAPNASVNIRRCSDTTSATFILTRTRGTGAVPTSVQPEDTIGRLQYSGFTGTGTASHAAIIAKVDGAVSETSAPGRLSFETTPSGSVGVVERMRITSAGNVGIGTTSPNAKLTVEHNDTSDAVRITQTGTGNALVVEDDTHPDATPLVINNVGQIISGATTAFNGLAGLQITADSASSPNANVVIRRCSNDSASANFIVSKTRGSAGSPSIPQNNDSIGSFNFQVYDGVNYRNVGAIQAFVDGTPGLDDAPARLIFLTRPSGVGAASTERMRIANDGLVTVQKSLQVSADNTSGGGIILADDGDIVDRNDGFCSMRFSNGVRVFSGNKSGTPVITLSQNGTVTAGNFVGNGIVPVGAVMPFAMNSAPSGWLAADGTAVSRSTYAALFSAIGTTHGAGDGSTTFNLPDLRGIFVRGSGAQTISGTTYSGTFAGKQQDLIKNHTHVTDNAGVTTGGSGLLYSLVSGGAVWTNYFLSTFGLTSQNNSGGGTETRPANIALLYCIKF